MARRAALAFGGRDLVAHPLADHLALELGKGEHHVEREPAHAGNGVERLGDRHERYPMLIRSRPVTALQSDPAPDTES